MGENKRVVVNVPLRVYVDVEVEAIWIADREEVDIKDLRVPPVANISTHADSLSLDDLDEIDAAVKKQLGIVEDEWEGSRF